MIIVTDGVPFPANLRDPTIESAAQLQRIATTFAVGITNQIDVELLSFLSSVPRLQNVNYFTSPDFDELEASLVPLLASVCETPGTPTVS